MAQTVHQQNVTNALLWGEAQHRKTHPAHPFSLLSNAEGLLRGTLRSLSDDPALAAYELRDRLPRIIGLCQKSREWADAVIDCDPSDTPTRGAVLRRKGA